MSPDEFRQIKATPRHTQSALDFVGGPLDGYQMAMSFSPDELNEVAALPINENILRMLDGRPRCRRTLATSAALYRLQCPGGAWRYRYLGATTPREANLETWLG